MSPHAGLTDPLAPLTSNLVLPSEWSARPLLTLDASTRESVGAYPAQRALVAVDALGHPGGATD